MKILIVSQYFWPENFSINAIARFLTERGHTVDVLTGIPNYPQGKPYEGYGLFKNLRQEYGTINIKRVWMKSRGQKGGDKRLILNYLSYAFSASCAVLSRIGKKYDVSLVYAMSPITQAYPALFLRKLSKVPVCLYVGDLWPDTLFSHGISGGKLKSFITSACSSIYQHSDSIIAVNGSFISPIEQYTNGRSQITYIPQAVEKIYRPIQPTNKLRHSLGINDGAFIVMYAGNIGFAQSPKTIVEAAEITKDNDRIHYVFVGDGTLRDECESYCSVNGLDNVHFIGRKPQEQMPEIIAEANAMLITLKNQSNYNLTLPGRTQAFMACGKPIICCANGETARVIKEAKAGMVSEAENSSDLAKVIIECASMECDKLNELGKNGRKYSEQHYDMTSVYQRIEQVLKETKYEK